MVDTIHPEAQAAFVPQASSSSPPSLPDTENTTLTATEPIQGKYGFVDYRAAASPDSHKRVPPIVTQIIDGLTTRKRLPEDSNQLNRSLPLVLLYDDKGLELFDRITYLPEYYLTNCEIEVLETDIQEIIAEIPDDSDVIELGCGSLRKTQLLLEALDQARSGVTYYAIDVMPLPLHESLGALAQRFKNISFVALCGTYDEVLTHFKKAARRKTLLWLGSSIGNYSTSDACKFLSNIVDRALVPNDAIIIGMDRKKDPDVIMDAYHDSEKVTDEFELNALAHVNNIIADTVATLKGSTSPEPSIDGLFDVSKFDYTGEYDEVTGRHSAYLRALEDMVIRWPRELLATVKSICGSEDDLELKQGELIFIESSYKFGKTAPEMVARGSGLTHSVEWTDSRGFYTLNLFRKPLATMSPLSSKLTSETRQAAKYGAPTDHAHRLSALLENVVAMRQPSSIPCVSEWKHMWSAWDALTLNVISKDKLFCRPIDLRHPFIFYLGHLPAFADIHMSRAESAPLTEPASYAEWFERGIDPNIEDPTICHSHSTPPADWPEIKDILAYRDRVRERIVNWVSRYDDKDGELPSAEASRHVWMSFEHEAMHIETLLYMVLQMDPADINAPAEVTFAPFRGTKAYERWMRFDGGNAISLGLPGDNEVSLQSEMLPPGHVFGWDNESPQTSVAVEPFAIRTQPITNGEYLVFLSQQSTSAPDDISNYDNLVPKSWIRLGASDDYGVRTVVGNPSILSTEASLWPVFVSHKQATAYADWCGKRLPSEAEWTHSSRTYHLAHALARVSDPATAMFNLQTRKSVDSYLDRLLSAHGLDPHECTWAPYDMYVPIDANIDLVHWHPTTEATEESAKMYDSVEQKVGLPEARFIGNAWEWTSTQFHPFEGFSPSPMYAGYSADFFDPPSARDADSTHYVVKGASYATHRRIAHRQTFRNWYQRAYPYVLATFRLCEDVAK
ncbi:hypothetical protein LPJ53_000441 [Coemansia erecta]|uniref:N-methyltransferase n=1 Tax=Coemansia erecta TaxID=147472 RepID=A0A9W7Y733_9FUNG|nr:hypothetical protein LPJ53_000441 [Coemansia erecta]